MNEGSANKEIWSERKINPFIILLVLTRKQEREFFHLLCFPIKGNMSKEGMLNNIGNNNVIFNIILLIS